MVLTNVILVYGKTFIKISYFFNLEYLIKMTFSFLCLVLVSLW